jgi:hypothetical protein
MRLPAAEYGVRNLRVAGAQEPLLYFEMARWSEGKNDDTAALRYYKRGLELSLERGGNSN